MRPEFENLGLRRDRPSLVSLTDDVSRPSSPINPIVPLGLDLRRGSAQRSAQSFRRSIGLM